MFSEPSTLTVPDLPNQARFVVSEGRSDWFAPDIALYRCDFELAHFDDLLFEQLGIACPPSVRRSVAKRRAEYLAGRYCASMALRALGRCAVQIAIGPNRAPLWPHSIVGSLSHCDGSAVAAVSANPKYRGIGIDIENHVTDATIENLERLVLCGSERALLPRVPDERRAWFTLIFSLKESFFKAAFATVGRYFDFDAVTVRSVDLASGRICFETNYGLADSLPARTCLQGAFRLLPDERVVTSVALTR
ncbi:4'-phosphopantetheinyl transferase superfamily protein [Steroidobacter sp. S1-65]|uniref:Enterobactin synthase component D n=1 Tax=Steroidobacter gossypii TaxID=2805490 RepID=A0ABS1WUD8_9GAMM|nr:4'-phosphopantetheinyl transferase superfamily protein [Steroidobacter gossypii]MBM0104590.1 4'-phosphopantetheinyl transferase superfamily protein [Steroidobacter gossypii]